MSAPCVHISCTYRNARNNKLTAKTSAGNETSGREVHVVQVKADKLREVKNGHDGTWVAHPALVTLALEVFNEHMPQPNQIDKKREDVHITRENLLEVCMLYCLLAHPERGEHHVLTLSCAKSS